MPTCGSRCWHGGSVESAAWLRTFSVNRQTGGSNPSRRLERRAIQRKGLRWPAGTANCDRHLPKLCSKENPPRLWPWLKLYPGTAGRRGARPSNRSRREGVSKGCLEVLTAFKLSRAVARYRKPLRPDLSSFPPASPNSSVKYIDQIRETAD